ncbi:MAG: murein biosynthesis integral membrane protein MurJ [Pseudomonadota bacterium]|nr:MAG: murein biosynthesis integral membrane protein MurJ [Pseudomonadota bacterium]
MGLLRSTAVVSGSTLVSRVLGFVRDVVFARFFGAGLETDAFFVAFKIPNFLRRLFAEGAFSQAFVPVLSEYKTRREQAEVVDLSRHVAGMLAGVLILVTVFAVLASPLLVLVFASGWVDQADKSALTAYMLRITFPYLLFMSLTALAGSILNTYGRFAIPAITPVLLNVSLISAAIWVAPRMEEPVLALAWGVFVAGLAQLFFQLPAVARLGLLRWPRWNWHHEGVQRVFRLMLPGIFGSSVAQINLLFDTWLATWLVTGSVSWLYYSDRLVEFPLGVFGIALATVILPSLSETHARSDPGAFSRTLDWALRWVLIIGTPATVSLVILAGPIISTLFQNGEFTAHDVRMASLSLMAYAVGLQGFILVKVLAPGYFARQDTRTPVRVGVAAMLLNMVLNVTFVLVLLKIDFPGPHAGLALATAIAAFFNAGLLLRGLRRSGVFRAQPGWLRLFLQVLGATVVMGALVMWLAGDLTRWTQAPVLERVWQLVLCVGVGGTAYFAALWLAGLRPGEIRRPA